MKHFYPLETFNPNTLNDFNFIGVDEEKFIDTNRFWYPTTNKVVKKVQALLAE